MNQKYAGQQHPTKVFSNILTLKSVCVTIPLLRLLQENLMLAVNMVLDICKIIRYPQASTCSWGHIDEKKECVCDMTSRSRQIYLQWTLIQDIIGPANLWPYKIHVYFILDNFLTF